MVTRPRCVDRTRWTARSALRLRDDAYRFMNGTPNIPGTIALGLVAKLFYLSLYRLHIWALHGFWRMALDTLARWIRTQTDPKVKLH